MEVFAVLWILGFLLAVVWILLPLAIVGTKPILRQQLDELRAIRAALERRP